MKKQGRIEICIFLLFSMTASKNLEKYKKMGGGDT